ncbi:hypothetical protein FRC17_003866 [Serendipita sp. 399]|nr:hypothetical protein FRC17_003866 [Serendipita sp. 399]
MASPTSSRLKAKQGTQPLSLIIYSEPDVPLESEEQIFSLIREMETTLNKLEREVEEAQRNLDLRKAAALEQRQAIAELRGRLSATGQLPDEILAKIFTVCVRHGNTSPWDLARVNQRFRRVTFDTRRLWAAITISARKRNQRAYTYRKSRHHCADLSSLHRILSMSGKVPLDIVIEGIIPTPVELLLALVEERERWDTLECYGVGDKVQRSQLFTSATPGTVRNVTFELSEGTSGVPLQWLERAKPVSLHIRSTDLADIGGRACWTRLESLSLTLPYFGDSPTPASLDNLLDLFHAVQSRLVRLELINVPFPSKAPIQFPRLRELSLENTTGWRRIECESLRRLKFGQQRVLGFGKITYPTVRELELCAGSPTEQLWEQIKVPNMDTLLIHDPGSGWFSHSIVGECRNIKRLRFCLNGLSSSFLHDKFPYFFALEVLEIYDTPPALPFFKKFEGKGKEATRCRNLKRFTLDFCEVTAKFDKERLTEAFHTVVRSRKPFCPLQSFYVEWPQKHGGGATEFVD